MRFLQRLGGTLLMGVLILGIAGCGQEAEQPAAPETTAEATEAAPAEAEATPAPEVVPDTALVRPPIKIGAMFAITGPASWLGEPERNMVEMIAEQVNAKGGVNGRKIELLVKDTQGEGDRAVKAVRELLLEDVVAIVGPSRSDTSMAVAEICEQEQAPLISCAAMDEIVRGRAWVFKTAPRDGHVVERIYDCMKEKGMTKVALIAGTTDFGTGGRDRLREQAPKYGIEIVADETYAAADPDMTLRLATIKAKNPDAVVSWSILPAQSLLMRRMKQLGMTVQLFQSHGFGNYDYLTAAGPAAEGVLFPAGRALVANDLPDGHAQKELLVRLKTEYEAKFEDPLSTFAGHAYDALMLVLEACEKKGATRQDIRDYIEGRQGFVGTGGVFSFSPEDHTGLQKDSLEMLTVRQGKFAIAEK